MSEEIRNNRPTRNLIREAVELMASMADEIEAGKARELELQRALADKSEEIVQLKIQIRCLGGGF